MVKVAPIFMQINTEKSLKISIETEGKGRVEVVSKTFRKPTQKQNTSSQNLQFSQSTKKNLKHF
jgi:hypothetical protein